MQVANVPPQFNASEVPYVETRRDHMPVQQVNGLDIAYEVIGDGRAVGHHPGGRFSKDAPGLAGAGRGAGRDRQAGASSGTARTPAPPRCASTGTRSRPCRPTSWPRC